MHRRVRQSKLLNDQGIYTATLQVEVIPHGEACVIRVAHVSDVHYVFLDVDGRMTHVKKILRDGNHDGTNALGAASVELDHTSDLGS